MVQCRQLPERSLCCFPKAMWAEMTDWPPSTPYAPRRTACTGTLFLMISPAYTIHHIRTSSASSTVPHHPGSVLYVKARRESRGWCRGLGCSPCTAQHAQPQAMPFSLRTSFILEFASCLALGPLQQKAMLPGGRSQARTVHASSYVPRSSSFRWSTEMAQNSGGARFLATSLFLDQVWLLASG